MVTLGPVWSGQAKKSILLDRDAKARAGGNMDEAEIRGLPELRVIAKFGVGLDSLDLKAMAHCGIELG